MALQLGYANPDKMLEEMTSSQVTEWLAYFDQDPWGYERQEYMLAMICCILANSNRDVKKRNKPYALTDFLPRYGKEKQTKKAQTMEEQREALIQLARMFGGKRKQ